MTDPEVVYVVDDDLSIRRSLARLLRARGHQVEVHEHPGEFLDQLPDAPVGCVILDLDMPGLDGLETQRALRGRCAALPIVFLTGRGTVASSVQAMKQGAVDFLEKPIDQDALFAAVDRALQEGRTRRGRQREVREAVELSQRLTAREYEVFELIAKGFTNSETGAVLRISRDTVKLHRARVMKKLEADSLADLVLLYHTTLGRD